MSGRFFQIDRHVWERVTNLGLNASVAYLLLACGTGADNRTTSWSVNAIEKYTGIGRRMAKRAIDALICMGALTQIQGGSKPRYRLEPMSALLRQKGSVSELSRLEDPDPHWIWLPNTLVTGAAGERPPVERIRALQDVRTLRQFITLYDTHDLAEYGGIHWRHIRKSYKRERITERGIWVIWGFSEECELSWAGQPVWDAFRKCTTNKTKQELRSDFWDSWHNLERLGLIECVPHLVEADTDEAAMICPCPSENDAGRPDEKALGEAARTAAFVMLEECMPHRLEDHDVIVPVPDGFPKVEMVGVYRLRYRPHTSKTAAWIAKAESHEDWRVRFDALRHGDSVREACPAKVQYQR